MTREATVWVCASCGNTVTVYIPIKYPPVCTRHLGAAKTMKDKTRYDNRRISD